jgi:hypothetical protein
MMGEVFKELVRNAQSDAGGFNWKKAFNFFRVMMLADRVATQGDDGGRMMARFDSHGLT